MQSLTVVIMTVYKKSVRVFTTPCGEPVFTTPCSEPAKHWWHFLCQSKNWKTSLKVFKKKMFKLLLWHKVHQLLFLNKPKWVNSKCMFDLNSNACVCIALKHICFVGVKIYLYATSSVDMTTCVLWVCLHQYIYWHFGWYTGRCHGCAHPPTFHVGISMNVSACMLCMCPHPYFLCSCFVAMNISAYMLCVPTSTPLMQLFHCKENISAHMLCVCQHPHLLCSSLQRKYIFPYVVCVPTSTPLMQSFHCSEYICSYACVCQHQYLLHTRIRGIGKLSKQSSSYFLIFLSIPPYLFSLAVSSVCVSFYLPDRQWADQLPHETFKENEQI